MPIKKNHIHYSAKQFTSKEMNSPTYLIKNKLMSQKQ
jgi:hypothetical protein